MITASSLFIPEEKREQAREGVYHLYRKVVPEHFHPRQEDFTDNVDHILDSTVELSFVPSTTGPAHREAAESATPFQQFLPEAAGNKKLLQLLEMFNNLPGSAEDNLHQLERFLTTEGLAKSLLPVNL